MFSTQEQFSAAAKSAFETQAATMNALTTQAFESFSRLVNLNVAAAKASLEESAATAQQLLSAKDVQEFFTLTSAQSQPKAEKLLAYGQNLVGIASASQAEFAKAAEAQIAEITSKVSSLIDEISKNAPAGSENAVALLKNAVDTANASYGQLRKSTKQATEAFEENITKATKQFSQAAEKATVKTAKK
ncbi:MAG: Phasin (PHA-granule associated protein) [Burkholderiales bacterium RIFCSPLOWO2_02_FULL_57_36]|nr:MAG: Phasin (PHA-granule associated protein) [Burkholderiales bacterium RIFCSPLOWO2_02_FULL_57_36]